MIRSICIFGPTASGKSALGLRLAQEIGGTVVSADSMQIYRRMDIGTAKPTKEELSLTPHKLVDFLEPEESFSVYQYQTLAEEAITAAARAGSVPIVVGGTGLYIDALLNHTRFGEMEIDPTVHDRLQQRAEGGEGEVLLAELREVDPESALPLHPRDLKRIVRALEVYLSTGKTLTAFKAESHGADGPVDYLSFFLSYHDRAALYRRIDLRVDEMIKAGLVEETERLYKDGVFDRKTASQAIGYKELLPYLQGERSLEECIALLKQKTRNFAKRQITWFKRYTNAVPLWMDGEEDPYPILLERSLAYLGKV